MSSVAFKCAKCQESYETGKELGWHLQTHKKPPALASAHSVPTPAFAPIPVRKRNKRNTIKISKPLARTLQTDNRIEYECYLCKNNYKKLTNMRKHMGLHTQFHSDHSVVDHEPSRDHLCEECGKTFTNRGYQFCILRSNNFTNLPPTNLCFNKSSNAVYRGFAC